MKLHWLYSCALCLSVAVTAATAQSPDYSNLNLSQSQQQAMADLDKDWRGQYSLLHKELKDEREKLLRLIASHDSQPADIMAGQARVAALRGQLRIASTMYFLRKRNLLSEDQQRRFDDIVRERLASRKNVQM